MLQTLSTHGGRPSFARSCCSRRPCSAIYRFGSFVPSPGVDSSALASALANQGGIYSLLSVFSGGGLSRLSLFALGIMPYITASIILQVLTPVSANLQALQKEGELGQRRITQYTRYLTVALGGAAGRSATPTRSTPARWARPAPPAAWSSSTLGNVILRDLTLTVGATLLMWMGELITQRGIGNGMSLLIFASILTSAPAGDQRLVERLELREAVAADRGLPDRAGGRVRAGGHPQDPDPVRQAHGGPADDLRRVDLPAAARSTWPA